jgi:hypothetical protein
MAEDPQSIDKGHNMIYDIWLGLNIFWEIALEKMPIILLAGVIWLVISGIALSKKPIHWCSITRTALIPAGIVTVVIFLLFPGQSFSSLSEMGYWVDWAVLSAIALGFGAIAFMYAVPTLIIFKRNGN